MAIRLPRSSTSCSHADGRYRLTEEIVTDPARSAVVIHASVSPWTAASTHSASATSPRWATAPIRITFAAEEVA